MFARRRAVAVLLIAALAVAIGWVARRYWPGAVRTGSAAAHGARILHYDVRSRFTHRTLAQTAAIPAGADAVPERRPLLVFLHGRGEHGNDSNSNGDFYAALAKLGDRAPAVVFPDGGTASYWHRRRSGDWGRYVLDEVIPQAVRRLHADPSASRSAASRWAATAPTRSPAAARRRSAPSAATRRRSGCRPATRRPARSTTPRTTRPTTSSRSPEPKDAGRGAGEPLARRRRRRPLQSGHRRLRRGAHIRAHHSEGAHDDDYWHPHYARYLRFYASALARC